MPLREEHKSKAREVKKEQERDREPDPGCNALGPPDERNDGETQGHSSRHQGAHAGSLK
jgi:hypothetical protein